jgi:hypothetical protein
VHPGGNWGLFDRAGNPRPSYQAFATMSSQLADLTMVRQVTGEDRPTEGLQAFLFRDDAQHALALWNISGLSQVRITGLKAEGVSAVSYLGEPVELTHDADGSISLRVGAGPVYLSGVTDSVAATAEQMIAPLGMPILTRTDEDFNAQAAEAVMALPQVQTFAENLEGARALRQIHGQADPNHGPQAYLFVSDQGYRVVAWMAGNPGLVSVETSSSFPVRVLDHNGRRIHFRHAGDSRSVIQLGRQPVLINGIEDDVQLVGVQD